MGLPLTSGQRGPAITDLRRRLARWQADNDLPPLPEGDVFDDAVGDAVRHFQRERKLPADTQVGPETWQALVEANHSLGDRLLWQSRDVMRGDDVVDLQHRLNQLGFDAGTEDGIFTAEVRAAVMDFQGNTGLDVDGIVGARTLAALRRLHRGHHAGGVGVRVREELVVRRVARRGLPGLQVMLDPSNPEDSDAGRQAADISWGIATRLAGRLAAQGSRTVLSRGRHTAPTPSQRAQLANRLGVDMVVSIAMNTSPTPAAGGCATYYYGSLRWVSGTGRTLAQELLDATLAAGLGPDCRTHAMTWTVLRETRMPAVVIEPGFVSNADEVARLSQDSVQDALARELVAGMRAFLTAYDGPAGG